MFHDRRNRKFSPCHIGSGTYRYIDFVGCTSSHTGRMDAASFEQSRLLRWYVMFPYTMFERLRDQKILFQYLW